jgi:preprotein translocase subunit SecG
MWQTLMWVSMLATAVILILLVLVQRGKGGGLAGALGGMGGQSAFGTKAGDTFTRITIGVASFWIFLCMVAVGTMKHPESRVSLPGSGVTAGTPAGDEAAGTVPADGAGGSAPAPAGESQ